MWERGLEGFSKNGELEEKNMDKCLYKKWWFWVGIMLILLSAFTPQILENIYNMDGWFFTVTTFGKDELLSFYGSLLSFLGTVSLGALALWQNNK